MKSLLAVVGITLLSLILVTAATAQEGPSAPILTWPPNGDQLGTHNVNFEWQSVPDINGGTYRIVVYDMDTDIIIHNVSGITGSSINLLLFDSRYGWYVIATDGAGIEGPASETSFCLILAEDHPAPDTTVTAPNGGEELQGDSYYPITWYALDQDFTSTPDLKVQIFYSRNNGSSWEQITQMDNNPGAYEWHVPNILCEETCLVRVTTENVAGMLGADDSDFAFTIIPTVDEILDVSLSSGGGGGGCFIATLWD